LPRIAERADGLLVEPSQLSSSEVHEGIVRAVAAAVVYMYASIQERLMESPCRVMDEVVTSQKVSLKGGGEVSLLRPHERPLFTSARLEVLGLLGDPPFH